MSEEERVTRLAGELIQAWAEDRIDDVELEQVDALRMVATVHAMLDSLCEARDRAAAERSLTIACEPRCTGCCHNLVMVFRGEVLMVATALAQPDNHEARQQFLDNYEVWREAIGDAPEQVVAARRDQDDERYREIAVAAHKKGVLCALNHDGLCLAYDARPSACRNCHALDSNVHCQPSSPRPPDTLEVAEITELRDQMRPLSEAIHEAFGGEPGVLDPLCEAVYQLLAQ